MAGYVFPKISTKSLKSIYLKQFLKPLSLLNRPSVSSRKLMFFVRKRWKSTSTLTGSRAAKRQSGRRKIASTRSKQTGTSDFERPGKTHRLWISSRLSEIQPSHLYKPPFQWVVYLEKKRLNSIPTSTTICHSGRHPWRVISSLQKKTPRFMWGDERQ